MIRLSSDEFPPPLKHRIPFGRILCFVSDMKILSPSCVPRLLNIEMKPRYKQRKTDHYLPVTCK
jgi:hypothetical protein